MTITLATLEKATAQEVYSQVRRHLLTQGRKSERTRTESEGKGTVCLYRSQDGTKCAAGCLISDEEYDESFERGPWRWLVSRGLVPKAHRYLIQGLQDIHDNFPVEDWKLHLDNIARDFDLIPV